MTRDTADAIAPAHRAAGQPFIQRMSSDPDVNEFSRGGAIALPFAEGRWQTKSLFVFDARERSLIRRTYTVWNTLPTDELDFTWIPDSVETDTPGRITGAGRLIWRPKGKPGYDRGSICAEYAGEMKDGKPEGRGVYYDRAGFSYEGNWFAGRCEGDGRLQLPNGDEYRGSFSSGQAQGEGIYVQSYGEIREGRFEHGLLEGPARITLPNGICYQSRWVDGKEFSASHGVRLAQLGPPAAVMDDIRLGVLVDNSPLRKGMLGYTFSQTTEGTVIRPANDRLMQLWKGSGDIELSKKDYDPDLGGIFSWSAATLPPVLLTLDIENRGRAPAQVLDGYIDVAVSATDFQPLVSIDYPDCGPQEDVYFKFNVDNGGWAPLEEATVNLAFAKAEFLRPFRAALTGPVRRRATVSVMEKLAAAGVNVKALLRRTSFPCRSGSQAECFSKILASGIFGQAAPYIVRDEYDIRANLVGSLQYKWKDDKGQLNARVSPCTVRVILGTLEGGGECEGADIEPIKTKTPMTLSDGKSNYRAPFAFRTTIAPGRVSRYSLPIRAPKSSRHDFRVVLVLGDGREIRSRPIDLLYFTPNRNLL
jgi:hypothetical protein